eukprot:1490981-Prorocentrum_lima.AAC.1
MFICLQFMRTVVMPVRHVVADRVLPRRLLLLIEMWRSNPGHSPTHTLDVQDCRTLRPYVSA